MADEKQVVELTVENCPELHAAVEERKAKAAEATRALEEDHDLDRAAELFAELGFGMEINVDFRELSDRGEEGSCSGGIR